MTILTQQVPLAIGHKGSCVSAVGSISRVYQVERDFPSIVRPRAELHIAFLRVEGKPSDVDGTRAFEHAWRDPRYPAC